MFKEIFHTDSYFRCGSDSTLQFMQPDNYIATTSYIEEELSSPITIGRRIRRFVYSMNWSAWSSSSCGFGNGGAPAHTGSNAASAGGASASSNTVGVQSNNSVGQDPNQAKYGPNKYAVNYYDIGGNFIRSGYSDINSDYLLLNWLDNATQVETNWVVPIGTYDARQQLKEHYKKSYERYWNRRGERIRGLIWQEDGWEFTNDGGFVWGDGQVYGEHNPEIDRRHYCKIVDFLKDFGLFSSVGLGHFHDNLNTRPSTIEDGGSNDLTVAYIWGDLTSMFYIVEIFSGAVKYRESGPLRFLGFDDRASILFYNSSGEIAKMQLSLFFKIGRGK